MYWCWLQLTEFLIYLYTHTQQQHHSKSDSLYTALSPQVDTISRPVEWIKCLAQLHSTTPSSEETDSWTLKSVENEWIWL